MQIDYKEYFEIFFQSFVFGLNILPLYLFYRQYLIKN